VSSPIWVNTSGRSANASPRGWRGGRFSSTTSRPFPTGSWRRRRGATCPRRRPY